MEIYLRWRHLLSRYWGLRWWRHKNDFSEIMGFIRLFGTTYLKKVHTQTEWLFSALNSWGFLKFKMLHTKLSYLLLGTDPKSERLVWGCVKLQTSLSSISLMLAIWHFAHILTVAVYIAWWGSKVRMVKFAKWWRHTLEPTNRDTQSRFFISVVVVWGPLCVQYIRYLIRYPVFSVRVRVGRHVFLYFTIFFHVFFFFHIW